MTRSEYREQAWEFARKLAEIDKQLLSTSAVEAITGMLVLAHANGAEEARAAVRAVLPSRLTGDHKRGLSK